MKTYYVKQIDWCNFQVMTPLDIPRGEPFTSHQAAWAECCKLDAGEQPETWKHEETE